MARSPARVRDFADQLVRSVDAAIETRLDFTPETLPFLDLYRDRFLESVDLEGPGKWRSEFLSLVAPMAGCYFGEVVVRGHEARWIVPEEDPRSWRIEFERCFLLFNPLGLAVETFLKREVEGVPGAFQVARDKREGVAAALDALPLRRNDDFYTFTMRWETLDAIQGMLMADQMARGEKDVRVSPEEYARQIASDDLD